ncbi:MAG TPA: hypothetical protein VNZ53_29490 [Steroidobacteraceae bacterium]|nr:hypothetical protein [Steroidobacteraceae bacterium]
MITDAGHGQIFIKELFELVVHRHLMTLAAFLVQSHPPALTVGKVILDAASSS